MVFGQILGAVGGIAGALGKSKDRPARNEAQSGYRTLPPEIQEYMMQQLLPRIKGIGDQDYAGLRLRRPLNEDDFDPVFGSKARTQFVARDVATGANRPKVTENNAIEMRNGVPVVNRELYNSDPAYRKAWDETLKRHQEQFGSGYKESSDGDQLRESILKRMGVY